jgi:CRP-like cAMP-binding protein
VAGNQLLSAMAAADARRLKPHAEHIALTRGKVLFQVEQPIKHVYFPHEGVVSLEILDSDGVVVEAATIGNEGIVGLGGLLAGDVSYTRQCVRLAGGAAGIPRGPFLSIAYDSRALRSLVASHADAFAASILQTAACNTQHTTAERLARWLLTAADRCGLIDFKLTHHELAAVLGVRRATITLIVGDLEAAGILRATRGTVGIADRHRLERAACGCYEAVTKNYKRVLADLRKMRPHGSPRTA